MSASDPKFSAWLAIHIKTLAMATFDPLSLPSPSSIEASLGPSLTLTSQRPTLTKGYPTHILGLTQNKIENNFLCSYCNALLRDPEQASCGHRFCQICLTRLIKSCKGTVLCPQCMREGINGGNHQIGPNPRQSNKKTDG